MKRPVLYFVLTAAFVLVLIITPVGCKNQTNSNVAEALDSLFTELNGDIPGGSFVVLQGDIELYSASYGLADIETGEPFTSATVANIGSITKTFVAYAILILEKQGRLSLDDSIIKYFPDFKNSSIAGKVKIIHLLTHTSGLPDVRNTGDNREFFLTADDEQNFAPLKLADSLEFEPGTDYNYSNPSYNGLALIVEQVTGMNWRDFVRKEIFEPAGMTESKITDGAYPESGVAHGYRKTAESYEEYDFGEYPTFCAAGNGGIWSSVEELAKYVRAIENSTFLDGESIGKSKQIWEFPGWTGNEPTARGISWVIHNADNPGKSLCIEHSGSQGGFRAHLLMYPDEQLTIIWLTNNSKVYTTLIQEVLTRYGYIR
jgi:CubicO group peptidase (beta-lactamase class C family)